MIWYWVLVGLGVVVLIFGTVMASFAALILVPETEDYD